MPAGRPSKYDPKYCEMIVDHMSQGASATSFAASIDVDRSTITEWADKHPEFSTAVKRGKARCAAWWEAQGRLGATGETKVNPTLVIFGLKNMAADDWREKQEVDHTSSDGSMTPRVDGVTIEVISADEAENKGD